MQIAFVHVALNISNLDPSLHIYVLGLGCIAIAHKQPCHLTDCILHFYSASEAFDATYPTNVVVTSEGLCTYIPPGIFMSSCPIDITWFPFDDQNCDMKFGSWTYNGFKVENNNK